MVMTAWEVAGLDKDYWCKHALDIRIRLAAAGYLGGDWSYSLTAPKVLYDIPDIMRADKMEITELQLRDGDKRLTNCSTLTMSILTSVYPNADWERDDYGQLQTGSYMDYCMPRADDVPDFVVDTTVTPCTHNPLGVKGCGEAGAIGSPAAIMNAVTDALGVNDISMPATAEKVWRALRG